MPDLSLKNLDESLMRAVRVAAVEADVTLRDFVIKALAVASGLERRDDIPQTKGQSKTEGKPTEISHPRRQRVKGADTALESGRQLGAGETGIQVAEGCPEGSARRTASSEPDGLDDGSHPVLIEGEVCENPKCGFPVHEYRPGMAAMKWICTNPERKHPQEPRSRVVIGGRLPDDFDFPEDEDGPR